MEMEAHVLIQEGTGLGHPPWEHPILPVVGGHEHKQVF